MNQLIAIVRAVAVLAPLVRDLVKAAEDTLPAGTSGKEKLALVRSWLELAMRAQTDIAASFTAVWPLLESTITLVVAAFNASGVFKKTQPAT